MDFPGFSWTFLDFHGLSWIFLDFFGFSGNESWQTMAKHGKIIGHKMSDPLTYCRFGLPEAMAF